MYRHLHGPVDGHFPQPTPPLPAECFWITSAFWHAYTHICTYVLHISVWMHACMHVRTYACTYVRMYAHTIVRIYVPMYVCACVRICTYGRMYVCSYVRMFVHVLLHVVNMSCVYAYIYIYIYILFHNIYI